MALPSPNLDDRKYQDIVDEAKRLIPQLCPEWTNHNLSDPGVALIELFAWMSEMLLFRINQVPERLYTKFLDLVGIEPFPSSSAIAELTFWLSTVEPEPVTVPMGTQVGTVSGTGDTPILFATTRELVIRQPDLVAAHTSGADDEDRASDAWDALRYENENVAIFTSSPDPKPGDALYLGFEGSLAGNVLRLDIGATIEGIGVDPRRAPLVWEIWAGEGWAPCRIHEDSTGGLNRDGTIVLLVPLAHEQLTLGNARRYWLRARLLPSDAHQPTYRTSPRIRTLSIRSLGGTVTAEHAQRSDMEVVGRSDGSPDQTFHVIHTPVLPRSSGETVRVVTDDGAEEWTEVADFTISTINDRHFLWDSASGAIRFGPRIRYPDGSMRQHGAVPRDGAEIVVTGYRFGGGASGNVGKGTLTALQTTIPYIGNVTNLTPAVGGVDPESVENAKKRGPMTLRTGQRAVTADDFERLTLEASPAVARARCLPPSRSAGPIRVLVVPHVNRSNDQMGLDDFALTPDLVRSISTHLDVRRVVGTSIEIGTPYFQGVTVAGLLKALPGRPPTLVRQRALDALYHFINPLTGGPDGDGWPFDADLNAATLFQLLASIDGVDRVDEVLFFEYDLRNRVRIGAAREVVRLDSQALFLSAAHQIVVR